ncbi:MAG TPA: sulfite exporter TauE/SafE family protein, partial [Acidobacteriota bacterium]|nr:sulfite exporter TauE/SafE family protein [Acidobacteriota bacterium]
MDKYFFFFVLVGFVAQMIDGALGMGYGVISTISLLGFGVSPAAASALVAR